MVIWHTNLFHPVIVVVMTLVNVGEASSFAVLVAQSDDLVREIWDFDLNGSRLLVRSFGMDENQGCCLMVSAFRRTAHVGFVEVGRRIVRAESNGNETGSCSFEHLNHAKRVFTDVRCPLNTTAAGMDPKR